MKTVLLFLILSGGMSFAVAQHQQKKQQTPPSKTQQARPKANPSPKPLPPLPSAAQNSPRGLSAMQIVRNEYIMLRKLPHSQKVLLKTFGERATREVRHIQNHHDQSMDQVIKISYTGANIDVYEDKKNPDNITILGMTLDEKKPRLNSILPIQVENTREDAEKHFDIQTEDQEHFEMCELQEETEGGPIYSSACVVFSFDQNKITKIDWVLPLD